MNRFRVLVRSLATLLVMAMGLSATASSDWPMWRYDSGRTAASPHELPDTLSLAWKRDFGARTQAWDDPLNQDLMQYDRVFEPIIAGNQLFMGFNDSDKVIALDLNTGQTDWTYYTDGPIRFPPVARNGKVYFCSDDGHLYCVEGKTGELVWKFRGAPGKQKVLGNRRVISMWPARGGPVLWGDHLYFAASIWPFMGTFIYSLDADTGEVEWVNDSTGANYIKQPHSAPSFGGVAPQGALVATPGDLIVPGGRSVPAVFDRRTGKQKYFFLNEGGKGTGGSLVMSDGRSFYVHTRRRQVRQFHQDTGKKTEFLINEPVLSADGACISATETVVTSTDWQKRVQWQIAADGSGDLIKAGSRFYAAGKDRLTAVDPPSIRRRTPSISWKLPIEGEVQRLLAGGKTLVAVTLDGGVQAFREKGQEVEVRSETATVDTEQLDKSLIDKAHFIVKQADADEGYAFVFGVGDGSLLSALAKVSSLHIIGIDPDAARVAELRRRFDSQGLYGTRIALHCSNVATFQAPQYIARLIVANGYQLSQNNSRNLRAMYQSVRPYGGLLWLRSSGDDLSVVQELFGANNYPQASCTVAGDDLLVTRKGALPDAAPWTHVNGNIANTVKSDDGRVKLPLGILWFGGNSNMDMLPRHGHGPPEQVIGGRQFIQGMNSLSARDVYTGQVLWKRVFQDLGTYQVFYDETYKNTPLDPSYNQVHIPGANARGANFVATSDALYMLVADKCLVLDPASGNALKTFTMPSRSGEEAVWGYLGVYENVLLGGRNFANFKQRFTGVELESNKKNGVAWSADKSASVDLVAFDRHSGKLLWEVSSQYSFLHNGVVAGGGLIYCLDKLPSRIEAQLARRGKASPDSYRILAVDADTGETVWQTSRDIFGTWLSYSDEHGVLLQAGAAAPDRSLDEAKSGLIAYQAKDGNVLWKNLEQEYAGPCIIYHDRVITNAASYVQSNGVFSLLTGKQVLTKNPLTGKPQPWQFTRAYGCNTAVAAENLLTFRSGAAGFYDLNKRMGTGNLGGFRSGCSSNLIAADGVLNAPDYTRTCSCGYQNQTSLALVHMPEVETWTVADFDLQPESTLERIGFNLGAPGDRLADDGTAWVEAPVRSGNAIPFDVQFEGNNTQLFCRHSSVVKGVGLPWVAASGIRNVQQLNLELRADAFESKQADKDFPDGIYTVRLHFCEPDSVTEGQRVFNIAIQGKSVEKGFDIAKSSGGRLMSITKEFRDVNINDGALRIEFTTPDGQELGPLISGVEVTLQ